MVKLHRYRDSRPILDGAELIEKANFVVCPNCQNEFPAMAYKFFGIISQRILRALFIAFLIIFIVAALYFGLKK
jgi:hypothetical protein